MRAIKLVDVSEFDLERAASLAANFAREYPDKIGFRNGVVYSRTDMTDPLYIYRTKTQIVVRGHANDETQ